MLNRIKHNLFIFPVGAQSLFVVFICAAIGTQDLKAAGLLSLGLSLIFTPTLLVLLVVDAVCYHFNVWDKVSAAYDTAVARVRGRRRRLVRIHPSLSSRWTGVDGPAPVDAPAVESADIAGGA